MIAPLRSGPSAAAEARRRLRRAHQFVAETLLPRRPDSPPVAPITPWKAWLLVGWVFFVLLAYAASTLGWL